MKRSVLFFAFLTFILVTISCEKDTIEEETLQYDIHEIFSTDPDEELEPGGSGGDSSSEKEEL